MNGNGAVRSSTMLAIFLFAIAKGPGGHRQAQAGSKSLHRVVLPFAVLPEGPRRAAVSAVLLSLATCAGLLFGLLGAAPLARAQEAVLLGAQNGSPIVAATAPGAQPQLEAVAVDKKGNIYAADTINTVVLEFPAGGGAAVTLSAAPYTLGGIDGLAVDGSGDVFVLDQLNNQMVKIPPGGGATQVNIQFLFEIDAIAADASGNLYVCGYGFGHNGVFKIPPGGSPALFADSGPPNEPDGVAVDSAGNVFIMDNNGFVEEVPPGGGSPTVLASGLLAQSLFGIAVDASDNVFLLEYDGQYDGQEEVVELTAGGFQFTVANEQPDLDIQLAADGAGNLYYTENDANLYELPHSSVNFGGVNVCPAGATTPAPCSSTITLFYKVTGPTTFSDAALTQGQPNQDFTITSDYCNGVQTAPDYCTITVRFAPLAPGLRQGAVLTGVQGYLSTTFTTYVYGVGEGPAAAFNPATTTVAASGIPGNVEDVAVDPLGNVYVASNNVVYEYPAGSGTPSTVYSDSYDVSGIALDGAGNLFVANSNEVDELLPPNRITLAGVGGSSGGGYGVTVDGAGNAYVTGRNRTVFEIPVNGAGEPLFTIPYNGAGIARDAAGDLFVADGSNVVEYPPSGNSTSLGSNLLFSPWGVAVDAAGDVFVSDFALNQIFEFPAGGGAAVTVSTAPYTLNGPLGIKLDSAGNLYIVDNGNNRILKVQFSEPPELSFPATNAGSSSSPQNVAVQNAGNQTLTALAPGLNINSSAFTQGDLASDCTTAFSLAPGAICDLDITFAPPTGGTFSGRVSLTDNALNTAAADPARQDVVVSGAGVAVPVPVTVGVNPAGDGIPFLVDGLEYTATHTFSWSVGQMHSLVVDPQNIIGPEEYIFTGWSNGPTANNQSITVSTGVTNYTASFTTYYQLTTAASSGGMVSPGTGGYYASGSTVNLTATANPGYVFTGWTGPVANASSTSTTVTMSAPESVTANFAPLVNVIVKTSIPGLSITVDNLNYTSPQTFTWAIGSSHMLGTPSPQTPVTGTQYTFASWSDGGSISHSVTVSSSVNTYTASFSTAYQLTTAASPTAGGTVTPASGGYDASGSSVNLTATASAGYVFTGWTGSPVASASSASTTLTMPSSPATVTANFAQTVNVMVQTSVVGLSVMVDGNTYTSPYTATWTVGATHTIGTASPQTLATSSGTQYSFASWSDNGTQSHTVTASVGVTSFLASFSTAYQLTTAANPTAGGTVTPASGGYDASGSSVNLTATASAGYVFTGWTGSSVASASSASTTLTMPSSPATVTANFAQTVNVIVSHATINYGTSPTNLTASIGYSGATAPTGAATFAVDSGSAVPAICTGTASPLACSASYSTATLNIGAHTINVSIAASPGFTAATGSGTLTVNPIAPSINFTVPSHTYGDATSTLIASSNSSAPIAYSILSGPASVSGSTLTITGAGTVTVQASQAAAGNYTSGSQTAIFTVSQATPVIAWPAPAPIVAGTPLSAAQLDATASFKGVPLPGTFVYTPALNAVLGSGTQTLSVSFSPTDNTDFTSANASVQISVSGATVSVSIPSTTETYQTWTNFVIGPIYSGSRVPTGTVTLYDNGAALTTLTLGGDGKAYYTAGPFNVGANVITATYSGDAHFPAGASGPATITVLPAPVNFQASCWGAQVYSSAYQCTVNLSASTTTTPGGTITYTFDGGAAVSVPIVNGNAPFTVPAIPNAGSHTLTLNYAAQGNFAAAGPLHESFTTQQGQTALQAYPSSYYLASGSSLTISGTATTPSSGIPPGTVTVYDNGNAIGTANIGNAGAISFPVTNITKGSHSYHVGYAGSANYSAASSASASVTAY